MIKALMWDWDGVISSANLEEAFSSSLSMPLPEEDKMKIFWKNFLKFGVLYPNEFPYCDKFYAMVEKESGYKVNSDFFEKVKMHVSERRGIIRPEIPMILNNLKPKYNLAILTSADGREEKIEYARKYDILKYFDYVFPLSGSVPLKPDIRIYKQVEETLKMKGKEIMVIDDNIVRGIRPAKFMNWVTCFFAPFKYLQGDVPIELKPDYTVREISQLSNILNC